MNTPSLLVHLRHACHPVTSPGLTDKQIPLHDCGLAHAVRNGAFLYDRFSSFDYVAHSQHVRSRQTARAQLAAYPPEERSRVVVEEVPALNERRHGFTQGMSMQERRARFPNLVARLEAQGEFRAEYPGGNSLMKMADAVKGFLPGLPDGKKALLCGHWGIHWVLRYLIEGMTEEEFLKEIATPQAHPQNCSLLVYERRNGRLQLIEKNLLLCR
jgi:2,3-bisphosphoglycerate-dependent phosphoglycerate mutase